MVGGGAVGWSDAGVKPTLAKSMTPPRQAAAPRFICIAESLGVLVFWHKRACLFGDGDGGVVCRLEFVERVERVELGWHQLVCELLDP